MALPSWTDFSTDCGDMPMTFHQMLAATLVVYEYAEGQFVTVFNEICFGDTCDDLTPFWNCNNNHIEPERAMVENGFALDDCGNLARKVFCSYASQE